MQYEIDSRNMKTNGTLDTCTFSMQSHSHLYCILQTRLGVAYLNIVECIHVNLFISSFNAYAIRNFSPIIHYAIHCRSGGQARFGEIGIGRSQGIGQRGQSRAPHTRDCPDRKASSGNYTRPETKAAEIVQGFLVVLCAVGVCDTRFG